MFANRAARSMTKLVFLQSLTMVFSSRAFNSFFSPSFSTRAKNILFHYWLVFYRLDASVTLFYSDGLSIEDAGHNPFSPRHPVHLGHFFPACLMIAPVCYVERHFPPLQSSVLYFPFTPSSGAVSTLSRCAKIILLSNYHRRCPSRS